jgi:hypothetical protein
MGAVRRAGRTWGEGAELAHPRDWPTRRGFEVQELERGYRRNREGPVIIGWEVVSGVRTNFVIFPREVRLKFGQIWG